MRRRKIPVVMAGLGCGAVLLAATVGVEVGGVAPLATGPPPDLNLVFTAQVLGWVEPCG